MRRKSINTIFVVALILSLTGCGGGGGGGAPPPPPTSGSSNWDTLVWDQDNWS